MALALFDDETAIRDFVENFRARQGRRPSLAMLLLPCQPPGRYFREHEWRVKALIPASRLLTRLHCDHKILLASGTKDRHGQSTASYSQAQLLYFAHQDSAGNIEKLTEIVEERSANTNQTILQTLKRQADFDATLLVSNRLHLWVAGVYFKMFAPNRPMLFWSSGWGRGTMNYPFLFYLARQLVHWVVAHWDREGTLLDKRTTRLCQVWETKELPPFPH